MRRTIGIVHNSHEDDGTIHLRERGWRVRSRASPRRVYQDTSSEGPEVVKGLHFGQRKLMLSEIEFITDIVSHGIHRLTDLTVVYAGAADGKHMPLLCDMFPGVSWYLVDPAPFHVKLTDYAAAHQDTVYLKNEYFTDGLAREIASAARQAGRCPVLISDIRVESPAGCATTHGVTESLDKDNHLQRPWHNLMGCTRSMLKFHPPYPEDVLADPTYMYLAGECRLGVWATKSSTEVRLWVSGDGLEEASYDIKEFEEQLYCYNTNARYASDCAAESLILEDYLQAVGNLPEPSGKDVRALSKRLSSALYQKSFTPLEPLFPESMARLYAFLLTCGLADSDAACVASALCKAGIQRQHIPSLDSSYLRGVLPDQLVNAVLKGLRDRRRVAEAFGNVDRLPKACLPDVPLPIVSNMHTPAGETEEPGNRSRKKRALSFQHRALK
eukprot:gene10831-1970_t